MDARELDTDLPQWPKGTRHYALANGDYVVIEVDEPEPRLDEYVEEVTRGAGYTYTQRPTVVIEVDENANATSLDRLHEFPPGTSHADALALIEG